MYRHYTQLFDSLFCVINEKLTFLQVFTVAAPLLLRETSSHDLSFICRLKLLSMDIPKELFLNSLLQYSDTLQGTLPEVRIFDWSYLSNDGKSKLLKGDSCLALKITALTFKSPHLEAKSFFAHFPALKWYKQYANPSIPVCKIPHFLDSLSVLPQLKYLEVDTDLSASGTVDYQSVTPQVEEALQPLPSVETLSIKGRFRKQPFLSFFGPFDRRFPSFKWLHLDVWIPSGTEFNLKEAVCGCMRQFAQHQLKGSLQLNVWTPPAMYREEFNFTEGRTFEDWHFTEEK